MPQGITRIVLARKGRQVQRGYYARPYFEGKMRYKWFGDVKYGGATHALTAAVVWYTEQMLKLSRGRIPRPYVRSNTGIRGLSWLEKKQQFEVAYTPVPRHTQRKIFSVVKFGTRAKAQAAAVAFLQEHSVFHRQPTH